ncbi:MAG: hypothetical protein DI597_20395 [Pseudoxanthomonas spadix]|nr:MAG: hypothetical protein DI597_20395 [Pseudoxanthomonas spadix]
MASRVDLTSAFAGLDRVGDAATGVARSMGVAAGKLVRDEAKALAPVDSGKLRDAIYLAYRDGESTDTKVVYQISWNSRKAPHGHLVEYGHWRVNELVRGDDGKWRATRDRLPEPVWTPAHPFMRPAFEATRGRLMDAAVARGRQRFAEIMAGGDAADEGEGE